MNKTNKLMSLIQLYRQRMRENISADRNKINAMHIECLYVISDQEGCTANTLVSLLDRDKSQISLNIRDMEKKGWLTRGDNPEDRRSKLLELTPEGAAILNSADQSNQQLSKKMLEGMSKSEVAVFDAVVEKMLQNLKS
ncbi:MarR family winged helix-turn-helix transcriptional regulator [Vibrio sinaloensis]|uniref:MarR family winged helix-turn-helix transcriptional regulator n=1 Tax=Photobacterium sp. (strain ATCC 43367) TaxID=379097 RepID=UPI00057DD20D|nr:MarR family transcriptional regulator [Vibrio sinaloensis]KHT51877.1 hypothetical protein RJ46_03935 [Vibrio sinaloensis]